MDKFKVGDVAKALRTMAFRDGSHHYEGHGYNVLDSNLAYFNACASEYELVRKEKPMQVSYQSKYAVITALLQAGAVLTGSRAFGTEDEHSDWDFFVPSCFNMPSSFYKEDFHSYGDSNTALVYHHELYPIHIQVPKDFALKLKAQKFMLNIPNTFHKYMRSLSKIEQREIWEWVFILVR